MKRSVLRASVAERIGQRRLVWVGTRGDDVEGMTDVPQFDAAFSVIAAMGSRSSIDSCALESITGLRPDLDTYDLDADPNLEAVDELRSHVLRALSLPSVMFPYRPSMFTTGIAFARRDRCEYLGMFHAHQSAFEYKPWLESSLDDLEVPRIPWRYIADRDQLSTLQILAEGPVMLRKSRTTGGVGLVRIDEPSEMERLWPSEREAFVSVAPFIDGGVPVNIGAVVWEDGVTVHPASVQLIGIESCTVRPFGYCGNDFGAVAQFGPDILDQIHDSTVRIGGWLRRLGYRGAYGVDYLVKDGVALFTEVNPRFQGSTHASCQFSIENDESCLLLEHLAAFLHLPAPPTRHVRDLARDVGSLAHVVVHNTGGDVRTDADDLLATARDAPGFLRADVRTDPAWVTEAGATVARLTFRSRLTSTGFELDEPLGGLLRAWSSARTLPSAG